MNTKYSSYVEYQYRRDGSILEENRTTYYFTEEPDVVRRNDGELFTWTPTGWFVWSLGEIV